MVPLLVAQIAFLLLEEQILSPYREAAEALEAHSEAVLPELLSRESQICSAESSRTA